MAFRSAEEYKTEIKNRLGNYRSNYLIFKPTHYAATLKLENCLEACTSKEEILSELYITYCDVLKRNSRECAQVLAHLIGKELGIDINRIGQYHHVRKKISWGIAFIHSGNDFYFLKRNQTFMAKESFFNFFTSSAYKKWDRVNGLIEDYSAIPVKNSEYEILDPVILRYNDQKPSIKL